MLSFAINLPETWAARVVFALIMSYGLCDLKLVSLLLLLLLDGSNTAKKLLLKLKVKLLCLIYRPLFCVHQT